jgi:hypothetical protein
LADGLLFEIVSSLGYFCLIRPEFLMNIPFPEQSFSELKNRTSAVNQEASVCTAGIGGPFKLLNHHNERLETPN